MVALKQLLIMVLLVGWLSTSCVSTKKYEALERRYQSTDRRLVESQKTSEFQEATIADLRQRILILEDLRKELTSTKEKYAALQGSNEQLRQSYENALARSEEHTSELQSR